MCIQIVVAMPNIRLELMEYLHLTQVVILEFIQARKMDSSDFSK